ncbi:hypothetical protein ONZ45_g15960 [Pleurotus djamor]|nr:hypothetical protein ONZ45_g15960 [Pleurotus djamor]
MSVFAVFSILFAATLFIDSIRRRRQAGLPLPPGPRKLPVIGNLLVAPNEYQWIKPVSIMLNQLMGWEWNFGLIAYGNPWRDRRRLFWQEFNPINSLHHQPSQLKHARQFLRNLLDDPSDFPNQCRYTPASSIIEVAYGLPVQAKDDPTILRADKATHHLDNAGITGTYLVDNLPVLQYLPSWFPGAGFLRYAKRAYKETMDMVDIPYAQARERLITGDSSPCVVTRAYLRDESILEDAEKERVVKDAASVAYSAGVDTTPAPLINFIAAMVMFPQVQNKAQLELDRVLGGRLPTFEDKSRMPYIEAIMWEVLRLSALWHALNLRYLSGLTLNRWKPVLPLGLAHLLMIDDVYNGYFLPQGSTIFANVWFIFKDESIFPQAEEFKPERFITADGKINTKLTDIVEIGFGFGRRICPGRFFARDSIWLWLASMITVFDITKSKDQQGREITPVLEVEPLLVTRIKPFQCEIKPRSKEAERLIQDSDLV